MMGSAQRCRTLALTPHAVVVARGQCSPSGLRHHSLRAPDINHDRLGVEQDTGAAPPTGSSWPLINTEPSIHLLNLSRRCSTCSACSAAYALASAAGGGWCKMKKNLPGEF